MFEPLKSHLVHAPIIELRSSPTCSKRVGTSGGGSRHWRPAMIIKKRRKFRRKKKHDKLTFGTSLRTRWSVFGKILWTRGTRFWGSSACSPVCRLPELRWSSAVCWARPKVRHRPPPRTWTRTPRKPKRYPSRGKITEKAKILKRKNCVVRPGHQMPITDPR